MQQNQEETKRLLETSTTSLKNKLKINIYVYGNQFNRDIVYKWFTVFRFFKPTRMQIYQSGRYCPKRFSEAALKEAALDKRTSLLGLYNTSWGFTEVYLNDLSASFSFKIPLDLWIEHRKEIISNYQEIFMELDGCFGFIVNCFDDEIIQNPCDINVYKRYKLSDSDFPGINNIPIIPRDLPLPYPMYQIDPSYLPGHTERYGELAFTTAPYMWFGPDFYRFFSQEKLEEFNDCQENVEIAVGYRRICLWDNVAEYNATQYRNRQWSFREKIEMEKVLKELNSKPFIPKDKNFVPDPTIEFNKGDFPHGGTLLAKFYVDKKGRPCSKSVAYAYIQREMDGHTIVWQERVKM